MRPEAPGRNPDIARYAHHSRWSDPGPYARLIGDLSADPARLPEIVGGLILHPLFAPRRESSEAALRSMRRIPGRR